VDIIITTALIPGRRAPILLNEECMATMAPGSVVVDLAAEQGGNCVHTKPGEIITHNGVTIIGVTDFPSRMPRQSSQMYGTNIANLLEDMCGGKTGKGENFHFDMKDVVVEQTTVIHEGQVLFPKERVIDPAPPAKKADAIPAASSAQQKAEPWKEMLAIFLMTVALFASCISAPGKLLGFMIVFVLSCVVGWKLIWNVAPALHTPLMSVTNAVSGIVLLGGMMQISASTGSATMILGSVACVVAAINVAGGFLVTQRMLGFFILST